MSSVNYSVTTEIHEDGNRYVHFNSLYKDPEGRRCYCVVFNDLSLNDIMCLTPKQVMMLKIAKGNDISIKDWTEFYGITPDMVENLEPTKYGVSMQCKYTFEDVLGHKSNIN
jgi:hypothetical protein